MFSALLSAGQGSGQNEYYILAFIAIIILTGFIFGKLAELISLPHITGYLIGGVLVGIIADIYYPNMLTISGGGLGIITSVGLGFIAFNIGTELWFPKLKRSGKKIIIVTIFQSLITTLVTLFGLLLFNVELWVACALAGIAAATAPGPLMMIVRKYKSKGELTSTVIPVVGLDDATGIIIFGILFSLAVSFKTAGGDFDMYALLSGPLTEIFLSLAVGILIGIPLALAVRLGGGTEQDKSELYLSMTLVVILGAVAVANLFVLSPILLPMAIGATFTNLADKETFEFEEHIVENFTPPIMVAFFAIAGLEFGAGLFEFVHLIQTVGVIALIYVILRSAGKMFGAYVGTGLAKSSPVIKKYLGLCLLPQAGIAIGMSLQVASHPAFQTASEPGGLIGLDVKTIILLGVIIYELFGPSLVKWALQKTGEIK